MTISPSCCLHISICVCLSTPVVEYPSAAEEPGGISMYSAKRH